MGLPHQMGGVLLSGGRGRGLWAGWAGGGCPGGQGGLPGLGTQSCLVGLVHDPRVFPQGAEQPNLGGEDFVVGELVQQLFTWCDKFLDMRVATRVTATRATIS